MAADWIKIEHSLPGKPEVMELSRLLDIDEMAVVGHLVCFWSWVDQNLSPECPHAAGTKRGLDRVAGRDGFVEAMVSVGWLSFDGHTVKIPNYDHHLSQSAKKRAFEARKKTRQRSTSPKCPSSVGTNEGQKEGPEKRREEKSNNIEGRAPENKIPDSLNDSQCLAAAEKWLDYLDIKGLQDKSPRGNEIALEAWWGQMAKFGRDKFLEAVEQSMSRGKWNVELHDQQNGRARKEESQDWVLAVKVAKAHPSDWKKRQELLPADVFEALKRTGSKAVAEGNSYELRILKDIFYSHLKDASSGITASN